MRAGGRDPPGRRDVAPAEAHGDAGDAQVDGEVLLLGLVGDQVAAGGQGVSFVGAHYRAVLSGTPSGAAPIAVVADQRHGTCRNVDGLWGVAGSGTTMGVRPKPDRCP